MTPRTQRAVEMAAIGGFEACHAYTGTGEGAQRWTWEMLPEGDGREYWRKVARAALIAALEEMMEPTEEMCGRGAAMNLDTMLAPGHPDLKDNGGKYTKFQLMGLETWRAMLSTLLSDLKGA
jgi:hypothetical protein